MKAHFSVLDDWRFDDNYQGEQYFKIVLTGGMYVCVSTIAHNDSEAKTFNIKMAKRQLINKLLEDLLETEDWLNEESENKSGRSSSGT